MSKKTDVEMMAVDLLNRLNYWIREGDFTNAEVVGILEYLKVEVMNNDGEE